jgi:hypothetical protein
MKMGVTSCLKIEDVAKDQVISLSMQMFPTIYCEKEEPSIL